jgi:undecaprenyl-diphosphatase
MKARTQSFWRRPFQTSLETIKKWDKKWARTIQRRRLPARDRRMLMITRLGDGGVVWLLIAGLFLIWRGEAAVNLFLVVLVSTFIANLVIKPLCSRLRPFQADVSVTRPARAQLTPAGTSFPSGHAMTSFAAATAIWHTSVLLGIPALLLAACIAFSRLYLFVHYPSDIIAGALLGVLCTTVVI